MFPGGEVAGFDDGHGSQIVLSVQSWLGVILKGDEEVGHGADEGIRKPRFLPAWFVPLTAGGGGEVDGAGSGLGIVGPADGATGEAFDSFDAPMDADVILGPFGPCPNVVQAHGAEAIGVLKDVDADPIGVFELLRGAWIGSCASVDAHGVSKPVAEGIDVMDGHHAQGDPTLTFLPRHPVGDGAHVDGGEDRIAQVAEV